jgi:hypothetical protein
MSVQLFGWMKQQVQLEYSRFVERVERISLPRAPLVTMESTFGLQMSDRVLFTLPPT